MVCNLAVSITKAMLAQEKLKALLTPERVERLLLPPLTSQFGEVTSQIEADAVTFSLATMTILVQQDEVTIRSNRGNQKALSEQVAARLSLGADVLFTELIEQLVQPFLAQAPQRNVPVQLANRRQEMATVFPIRPVAGSSGRVFALSGGRVEIFIDEGEFLQAKAATQGLLSLLQAKGLPIQQQGEVEQHRAGGPAHVHQIQQQKGHIRG